MLLNEMLLYHKILIYLLLLCSISGYMLSLWGDIGRIKNGFRIYTFAFHALISSAGFGGLITFTFAKRDIDMEISIMILSYMALTAFEVIKYLKILKSRDLKEIKAINLKWTLLSIVAILINFWRY